MRGHILKRGRNSYSVVISLGKDPVTNRPKQQWVTVKGSKKDAERRLAELLHQVDTGTLAKPGKQTLGVFLNQWLETVKGNLSPRTVEGYNTIIKRVIPYLGAIPLVNLKPDNLQKYYSDCLASGRFNGQGGLHPLTVRHHHALLHRALHNALEWGLILRNPADAVHPPRTRAHGIKIMNEGEIQLFLEAAKNTPYYALFHTALYTGMRRSEILALQWADVDLLFCQLSVCRTIHQLKDRSYIFRQPKSAKGRRMVALSPSAVQVLREHREKTEAERIMLGLPLKDNDLVFAKYDGSPIRPDTITRAWSDLAKKCGISANRLHDARHSHASLMLKQGTHPKIVQERLGHSTIAITLDTYSHVAPGLQEAAAKRFDDALRLRHNEGVHTKTH